MTLGLPIVGADVKVWANDLRRTLGRQWDRLSWRTTGQTASDDGIILWDAQNGYPVVSLDGKWEEVVLGSASFDIAQAERVIEGTYGDVVSVKAKAKNLLKFGKNVDLDAGSSETIWATGGNETYVTTNVIDTISSSSAGDTQSVVIEGHTVSGTGAASQFTFVSQTATLNGQNKVVLSTPLARVSRLSDTGSTDFAGDVYVYEDDTITGGVPNTASKIHISALGSIGDNQSFKAATTFSNTDYFICTGGWASVRRANTAVIDFIFEVRLPGGTFRPVSALTLNTAGAGFAQIDFKPYVIVPKNSDLRVVAISSTNNVQADASFQGYLAAVQA